MSRRRPVTPEEEIESLQRKLNALRSAAGAPLPREQATEAKLLKFTATQRAAWEACARRTGLSLSTWIKVACDRATRGG